MILDDIIKQISSYLRNYNDDAVDRLHYLYSVIGLSIYLLFITSKQYYGDPIQCMTGTAMNGDMVKYAHSMCWLNGTYHVEKHNGSVIDFTTQKRVYYYQWIVFIILFKIFLFRIPSLIWNFVMYLNGFDMVFVTKVIMNKVYLDEYVESSNWTRTQKTIESISDHIRMTFLKQKLLLTKKFNIKNRIFKGKRFDEVSRIDKASLRRNYPNLQTKQTFPLFIPYLFIKAVYLANIAFNFLILTHLFGFNYLTYGYKMLELYLTGQYEFINEYFPKRAMCDVSMTHFRNENFSTFLCSLPINLFNELFYFGYWYWLMVLIVITIISVFYWLLLLIKPYRRNMVLKALQLSPSQNINSSYTAAYYFGEEATIDVADSFLVEKTGLSLMENFELFFTDVCSIDVIFTIRMISMNSNALAVRDILNSLWDHYLDLEDLKLKDIKNRPIMSLKRPPSKPQDPNEPKAEESDA